MIQNIQFILNNLSVIDLVLLAVFHILFMLRMIYIFFFTGKLLFGKKEYIHSENNSSLSLILTVRNEEENLKNNLPKILAIKNVNFEVIAVDDFSQDNSFLVLGELRKKNKHLKISTLNQETRYSIKHSQNIALKAAKNDWVIPISVAVPEFSEKWLQNFAKSTVEGKTVVIAYSGITESNEFYNRMIRIESFFLQLKSAGFILNQLPFVYSEENVAFRKSEYFEKKGFGQHLNNPFANLELIINSFITKASTILLFNRDSALRKTGLDSKKDYFELVKKSIRIEDTLSHRIKSVLIFDEITRILFFPFSIISLVFMPELWPLFLIIHGSKILVYLLIIKTIQNGLNESKIYVSSLIYDLIMPYFRIIYKWHFNWRSKKKWRGKT